MSDSTGSRVLSVVGESRSRKASSSSTHNPVSGVASVPSVTRLRDKLQVIRLCRCDWFEGDCDDRGLHCEEVTCNGPYVYAVTLIESATAPRIAYRSEGQAQRGLSLLRESDDDFISGLFVPRVRSLL